MKQKIKYAVIWNVGQLHGKPVARYTNKREMEKHLASERRTKAAANGISRNKVDLEISAAEWDEAKGRYVS